MPPDPNTSSISVAIATNKCDSLFIARILFFNNVCKPELLYHCGKKMALDSNSKCNTIVQR